MKSVLIVSILILCVAFKATAQDYRFRTGDLIFQENGANSFTDAITGVTKSAKQYNFSHVGVIYQENGEWFVLEAIPYGVSKTAIASFLKKSKIVDGKPAVAIGRIKAKYRKSIPDAIEGIKKLIGKRYDMHFSPTNDMYYCSEIIYLNYKIDGKPIFKSAPMTFRDKNSGEMSPLWIRHFEMLKSPIPEGVEGTNPGDMSKERKIIKQRKI